MASSGNYKRVPDEKMFIPAVKSAEQTQADMMAELAKLQSPPGG